ncbi:phosphoadenosine phosphosulfate reductase [Methanococcus vannielii SB]|uniref:Phosphoadenosine phosphosulfate reductase n=1 Tax=Methanococcus vannielii (strain ATCC 35089 / DSM 1224 / JCM 13029 / OCM 148 / SB) TaxID=406327 RepID=A6UNT5_METVS|nr:phosphoadenosine phosphosulfate reductase family protein [Methanococcus vannielii]ABR54157.1 phosphoadenosine phosphosulfate reductase [Methanococcus vannielii SB]
MKTVLGKIHLKWCKNCNVPVLDKTCGICNLETFEVKVTPPGDARPAFKKDIELITKTLKMQFGLEENIFKDKLVLLNKAPGVEYFQEIILDGQIIGLLNFNEKKHDWKIIPTIEGARRLINAGCTKKILTVKKDVPKYILESGASVLRPGVSYVSEDIKIDDDILILIENDEQLNFNFSENDVLGVGRARMDYSEIISSEKGMVAKVRKAELPKTSEILLKTGTFEESIGLMIQANEDAITRFESNSVGFMKNTAKRIERPISVAYSGGKDSLTVLLLAITAFRNPEEPVEFDVLFNDTGLEFDETLENVDLVDKLYGLNILKTESGQFWEKVEEYGPPGRDNRWCSEICKVGPLGKLIDKKYEKGCLTFVGIRKYESFSRSKKPRIWNSPTIEKQMLSSPILNWSAMHVWIYLFKNKAPYNVLYTECFDRVGCFMCPAMEIGEIELVKQGYPKTWDRWEDFLKNYAKIHGKNEEWVSGDWRWTNKKSNKN